jgi:hypothetical protein
MGIAVAAFRFGHSQVRSASNLNSQIQNLPIFAPGDDVADNADLRGGKDLPQGSSLAWEQVLPIGTQRRHRGVSSIPI